MEYYVIILSSGNMIFFFQQLGDDEREDSSLSPVITIHPIASTATITTTSSITTEVQNFSLLVGNITFTNFCNITPNKFDKLTAFYHQYCMKGDTQLPEEKDGEG